MTLFIVIHIFFPNVCFNTILCLNIFNIAKLRNLPKYKNYDYENLEEKKNTENIYVNNAYKIHSNTSKE